MFKQNAGWNSRWQLCTVARWLIAPTCVSFRNVGVIAGRRWWDGACSSAFKREKIRVDQIYWKRPTHSLKQMRRWPSINQSINHSINHSLSQSINQSIDGVNRLHELLPYFSAYKLSVPLTVLTLRASWRAKTHAARSSRDSAQNCQYDPWRGTTAKSHSVDKPSGGLIRLD